MSEILRLAVTADPPDGDGFDLSVNIQTDGTPMEILIGLTAAAREIWRDLAAADPDVGALFRDGLTNAVNNPGFWTREEGSSHD